ncbi:hypothetical protein [Candidatus Symbiopectobacterium sp. NZEC135]|uniref:hypothetical protein n=1 Tax=Candidatus Symbiopectobacterium sp. NZEC135 TaxID=2820471 RepID=UPI0022262B05|nr:hypothetical protein [Candidatus Symbiopectobacterium sp. NZEC135]MCW2477738.1 hypothetical protein [Candidatus Symbiopectobacterium sp. NZEC135]
MSIRATVIAVLLALIAALSFGVYYYHDAYSDEQGKAKRLGQEVAGQKAVISRQAFEFNRFNQISQQASQYATNIKGQSDERQIVYRTIIKRDPASRQCVPDDVAGRLLDYTNGLRASAMHTDSGKSDTTSASAIATACRLTYAQAVYWIDPLLTAIDQANSQLAGIREIETSRQNNPDKVR